jgi:hypothetical protein
LSFKFIRVGEYVDLYLRYGKVLRDLTDDDALSEQGSWACTRQSIEEIPNIQKFIEVRPMVDERDGFFRYHHLFSSFYGVAFSVIVEGIEEIASLLQA